MNVSFVKVKNPVLRWFAGFGVIIGCAAVLEGLLYGVGAFSRWFMWNIVYADHSQSALEGIYWTWGILGIARSGPIFEEVYSLIPLTDIAYNNLIGFFVLAGLFMIGVCGGGAFFLLGRGSHQIGEKLFALPKKPEELEESDILELPEQNKDGL